MSLFQQRRIQFIKKMQVNSMALFPASAETIRNNDCEYPFRQNSDFHYLSGFDEPDAILMLIKNADSHQVILFNRKKDKSAEIWHGYRLGQAAAITQLSVDEAYPVDEFETQLESMLNGVDALYYPMFQSDSLDASIKTIVNKLRVSKRRGAIAPRCYFDCLPLLHEMRVIKSEAEAKLLAEAAEISASGHVRAMQTCHVGMWEYQLEAEIKHQFALQGTRDVAYNSIVAGGNNACILHYTENDKQLKDGDLVLIDAGAEYQGYAGDITRTFPVNGTFTEHQATLYQLVLDIQVAAINQVKPGVALVDINKSVVERLVDGLLLLGLLSGDRETLIEDESYKAFYMHGIGHYLGLDVHDAGDYGTLENPRLLEAGMAITIEPGLYVSHDADVEDCWKGIGIRIEDDLLVTEHGAEVLSADVPKTIDEIEALMADAKTHG
ncbi:Xaa-Pro aminopeptidase [Psychromonas sp. Urea-02u-13]|uniref:Xaa-Pro aminopeptidase n=1 Tax=Psychromonas sp. Urea-02u-13 TaxID=2058326 RepID=UPI000C324D1E|nr:Xaa-Pro aminopeptidase [Psychromonas sp. Urea-02u-13]PKG39459.1 Xaa-Pro aminopeptidase [Psychromonas sp. Urea-02u-13]